MSLYYFVTNLQGDVVRITNAQKETLANYAYDAYGKLLSVTNASGTTISDASNIALINPLRYRGYYYDSETELYYLQSRYYDPTTSRFINADSYASTGQDFLGYNMFAYCGNNPVMRMDGSGHDWIDALGDWFADAWDDVATFFNENIIEPVVGLCSGLAEDVRNVDTNNQSEQKVIDSNYFSFYKGKLVIRADISRSGTFGVIFLGRNVTKYDSPEDVVRHEYGHALQFEELGVLDFALCVGIPSWRKWGSDAYYDKPWEADADIRGGVISRNHTPEVIEKAQSYIQFSKKYGIIAWLTIE